MSSSEICLRLATEPVVFRTLEQIAREGARRALQKAIEDEAVVVSCGLERIGNSSLTLREQIRTAAGELSAESEAVIVARDRENGGSRSVTRAPGASGRAPPAGRLR